MKIVAQESINIPLRLSIKEEKEKVMNGFSIKLLMHPFWYQVLYVLRTKKQRWLLAEWTLDLKSGPVIKTQYCLWNRYILVWIIFHCFCLVVFVCLFSIKLSISFSEFLPSSHSQVNYLWPIIQMSLQINPSLTPQNLI